MLERNPLSQEKSIWNKSMIHEWSICHDIAGEH